MLEPQIVVVDFAQQACWAACRETIRNMSLGFQVFNFRCCDVIWVFSLSRFLAFFNHSWKDGVWKCEHESEKFGRNITSEILRSVPGPISPRTAANPGKSTIWRNPPTPAFAKAGAAPGTTTGVELVFLSFAAASISLPFACTALSC